MSRAPFVGALTPVTVQLFSAQRIDPCMMVPVVQDGWTPVTVYPVLHVRAHVTRLATILAEHAMSRAPFIGAMIEVVQLASCTQVIDPASNSPLLHIGCVPVTV